MNLYIVKAHFDYEGFTIMGIFDNEEAARSRACEKDCVGFDKLTVCRVELNRRYNIGDDGEVVWKG
jgi:hypothetical protein